MAEEETVTVKPTSNISFRCPILGETNYPIWSLKIKAIFKAHDLWDTIDPGTDVDAKKDNATIAYLYQALPEELILQIASCESAKEIWESIKTRHLGAERVMEARLQSLKMEFDLLRMKEGEKVDEYVAKLSGIATKSATLGSAIEEAVLVRKLLTSIPDSYISMVATIEQLVDLKTVKFQEVVGRLKAYEERVGSRTIKTNNDQLLLSYEEWESKRKQERNAGRGRGNNSRGQGRGQRTSENERGGRQPPNENREPKQQDNNERRDRRSVRCFNCDKPGHHGDDCRTIRCYNCDKLGHHGDDCRTVRCYNCDKLGHYAEECWNKRKPNETKEETLLTEEYQPALLMARCLETEFLNEKSVFPKINTKEENGESVWYLDNGASNHMTGNKSHFYELDEKIVGKVRFGDNTTIDIKGKGTVLLQCKNGEQRLITNVYYTPHLCSNILSLGQFTEVGCRVMIEQNTLKMHERSGKLLLKVERTSNRLYKIKLQTIPPRSLPNKLEEKVANEERGKSDLIPAAPNKPNSSQMEGQNTGKRTARTNSKFQPITASVSSVLEAGNQPNSSKFGAAGGAPEKQPQNRVLWAAKAVTENHVDCTHLVFGSFNMKKDETKKRKGMQGTTDDAREKSKEVHQQLEAEKKKLTVKTLSDNDSRLGKPTGVVKIGG